MNNLLLLLKPRYLRYQFTDLALKKKKINEKSNFSIYLYILLKFLNLTNIILKYLVFMVNFVNFDFFH